jgi:hypothetical protein
MEAQWDKLTKPHRQKQERKVTRLRSSQTPEDKFGPAGYDAPGTPAGSEVRYIPATQTMSYRVEFWNKPDAPVPTQDAVIKDTLDADVFDLSTFEFTDFGFLKWDVPLPGGQAIDMRVDLRPDMDLAVDVTGTFNPDTGEIEWWFHCVDPMTGNYPEDPMAGFLPPYNPETGYEIGWVEFRVKPKADLPDGTQMLNQAFVEFDFAGDIWDHPAPKEGPWINTIAADSEGDGVPDPMDNCPETLNPDQTDSDSAGVGDACDDDDDNDGWQDTEESAAGSDPLDADSTPEVCDGVDNDGDCPGDTNGDGVVCGCGTDWNNQLRPKNCDDGVDEGFTDSDGNGAADCYDDKQGASCVYDSDGDTICNASDPNDDNKPNADPFTDDVENYVGTNKQIMCSAPPVDGPDNDPFDNNADSWADILDIMKFVTTGSLNTDLNLDDQGYWHRLDINKDTFIDILDVMLYVTKGVLNDTCPYGL